MSEHEPQTFSEPGVLRMQALDKADVCAGAGVRSKHRRRELAPQRIFRVVFDCSSEEATVQIEDGCSGGQSPRSNAEWRIPTDFLDRKEAVSLHSQLDARLGELHHLCAAEARNA